MLRGADGSGYSIQPRVFEGLRQIFEGHAHPEKAHEDQQGCRTKCHLRAMTMQVNDNGVWARFKESKYPPSYLSFIVSGGLYELLPAHLKSSSRSQGYLSGQNLLLASCVGNCDIGTVRELLREGWSPKETIIIETPSPDDDDGDDFGSYHQDETPATLVSIWLAYLYELAFSLLRGSANWKILEEFLHLGVDHNVQFVISARSSTIDQSTDEQRFTLSLLELVGIFNPSNMDAIRTMLQTSTPWWTKFASNFVSGSSSSSSETPSGCRYKTALSDVAARRSFTIESVIASTERLDIPFRYHLL